MMIITIQSRKYGMKLRRVPGKDIDKVTSGWRKLGIRMREIWRK